MKEELKIKLCFPFHILDRNVLWFWSASSLEYNRALLISKYFSLRQKKANVITSVTFITSGPRGVRIPYCFPRFPISLSCLQSIDFTDLEKGNSTWFETTGARRDINHFFILVKDLLPLTGFFLRLFSCFSFSPKQSKVWIILRWCLKFVVSFIRGTFNLCRSKLNTIYKVKLK